jgi:hypothetical protein
MSTVKAIILATGLALASTAAFAVTDSTLGEGSTVMYSSTGESAAGTMTEKGKAELLKHAKPLDHGVIIFRHAGKLYMAEDPGNTMYKSRSEFLGNF